MAGKYKRIYIGIGTTLIGLFSILTLMGLQIVDTTGDIICAGTVDDPCVSYFEVRNPTAKSIYIYNYDEVQLNFSPDIKGYELYVLYYGKWHYTNFTKETRLGNIPNDRKYSFVFPRYSIKKFKLVGYKHNPEDNIKWSVGTNNAELDPLWKGIEKKIVTYTRSTKTNCGNNKCWTALYSGTKHVYEDDKWKKVEDARSLKGQGFEVVFIERDVEFPIEVMDFNYTSITIKVNPNGKKNFKNNAPIRIWERNSTNSSLHYKKTHKKIKDEQISVESLNKKEVRTYDFGMNSILEFGYNSTTIQLQDANTENLEDITISYGSFPNFKYGIMVKFNMSSIPSMSNIDASSFNVYLFNSIGGLTDTDLNIYRVASQTWTEDDNTASLNTAWGTKTNVDNSQTISNDIEWKSFNVTTQVTNEWDASNTNITIGLEDPDNVITSVQGNDPGTTTFVGIGIVDNLVQFYSKEHGTIATRPYLNITYTPPECSDNADCALCYKCVDYVCVIQTSSEDLKDECTASYDDCDNQYTRRGPDGLCDGVGACDTNDAYTSVQTGYVCNNGNNINPSGSTDCGSGDAEDCNCAIWYECVAYACTKPEYYTGFDDMVGWWKFDDNSTEDFSSYGNDGIQYGGVNCSVDGHFNGACEFDGVNDYINCGNNKSLNLNTSFTMSIWFDAYNYDNMYALAKRPDVGNGLNIYLNNDHYVYIIDGGGNAVNVYLSYYDFTNYWNHFVIVVNSTGNGITTYRQGSKYPIVRPIVPFASVPTQDLYIGTSFNGKIDDVRIWNRELTDGEIRTLTNAGASTRCIITNWQSKGTSANVAQNVSVSITRNASICVENTNNYCGLIQCDGDAITPYYYGWDATSTCLYKNDTQGYCDGAGSCDSHAYSCPSGTADGSSGVTCAFEEWEEGCSGTTIGICTDGAFNITESDGTVFYFYPSLPVQTEIEPYGQTSTKGMFSIDNNLTYVIDIYAKLDETNSGVTLKLDETYNYDSSVSITDSYRLIYDNLSVDDTGYLWAWADFNNLQLQWEPELYIVAVKS